MCTRENPAAFEVCTWLWRTSPRHVPSLSVEVWRSARSGTSGAASKEQTSPILTATHSSCRRWRGAKARGTRRLLTPRARVGPAHRQLRASLSAATCRLDGRSGRREVSVECVRRDTLPSGCPPGLGSGSRHGHASRFAELHDWTLFPDG